MVKSRDYGKEYRDYHAKPAQKKRRASRNRARTLLERAGRVSSGDGKDVHHKDNNPRNNSRGNLSVMSRSRNRSIQ